MTTNITRALRLATAILAILFTVSAIMNLGFKVPLGFATLGFSSPSSAIAAFEILIAAVLFASAWLSNSYLYGGAYILTTVGIAEGLISPSVQGLARSIHEAMIPILLIGWALFMLRVARRTVPKKNSRKNQVVTALQFFVGALVTFGGAAFVLGGSYPVGTLLGAIHLAVGIAGLIGGLLWYSKRRGARQFLIWVNLATIIYSALAESFAEIYGYLPRGINDAFIGTIIAIVVSVGILFLLTQKTAPPVDQKLQSRRLAQ
jgi:hypothetical protein